jgi:predicted ATPase
LHNLSLPSKSKSHRVASKTRLDLHRQIGEAELRLGQTAEATNTMLRYTLVLGYFRNHNSSLSTGSMQILKEELSHIKKGEARKHLLFKHSKKDWLDTLLMAGRRVPYFISTEGHGDDRIIKLHQDGGGSRGKPLSRSASNLPRTVLSAANAAESPTVLCARREMESWRILQLEPSALRKPDEINAPSYLTPDGGHLPATLYRLSQSPSDGTEDGGSETEHGSVLAKVANRLGTLIGDVSCVRVDRDDRREILSVQIAGRDGTEHPARSLSDGTLRFLALSVLELDATTRGVVCLEEPENGIHPERIPAMLRLLQDIAIDSNEPVDGTNPLRQVIVNTHSPAVVGEVPDDSLLVAETKEDILSGQRFKKVRFLCLSDTWRDQAPEGTPTIYKGKLIAYLNPISPLNREAPLPVRRVVDREDLQMLLPFGMDTDG